MSTFSAYGWANFTNLHSSGSLNDLANILVSDAFRDQTHIRIFLYRLRSEDSPPPIIAHDHLVNLRIDAWVDMCSVLDALSLGPLHAIEVVIMYTVSDEGKVAISAALEALFERTPSLIRVGAEHSGRSILSRPFCRKIIEREIATAQ